MAIIILEGCDCSGKSTLAHELQRLTGYEIIKGSSFEIAELGEEGMHQYMLGLLDKKDVIIDRFYLSNYVYGNLYSYPTMTPAQLARLASKAEQKALTVYLTADVNVLRDRMKSRGDDMIRTDGIPAILAKYQQGINQSLTYQSTLLQLNTNVVDIKKAAGMIAEFADLPERKMFANSHL